MKKSYKIMALLLVAIMCVGCFTGCGKTEEEKAMEEIAEKFEEGLKQDEQLDSEFEEVKENLKERDEVIREMETEDFPALREAYNKYKTADDSEKMSFAEAYNKLFDECVEKRVKQGLEEDDVVRYIADVVLHKGKISTWTLDSINLYKENYANMNSDSVTFSWNKETGDYVYFFSNYNALEGTVLKKDGTTCKVDATSVADATGAQVDSFSSDELIFIVFTNSDTKYCRFDISGENAVLVDTTTDFIVVDGYERFNTSNDINSFTESVNLCK
jgi:hypothetical protein